MATTATPNPMVYIAPRLHPRGVMQGKGYGLATIEKTMLATRNFKTDTLPQTTAPTSGEYMAVVRAIYRTCLLLAALSFLTQTASNASGSEKTDCKFSVTHKAVKNMSPDELKTVIKSALEYRISECRNVHYDLEHRFGICDFDERVPTNFTKLLQADRVECWALGNSFHVETEDRQLDNGVITYIRKDSYDAETGVSRSFGMKPDRQNQFGAIDSKLSRIPFRAPYIYWITMPDQHQFFGEFFFVGKLVAQYKTWQFRVLPDGSVELECDWTLSLNKAVPGKLTYVLDPVKGFLPTSCYGLWKNPSKNGWSRYELRFVVDESKLVNDLWMPTKLRYCTCADGDRAKGNLDLQTVNTVELGNTKESDLRFSFPEGARVQDRLRGIAFKVGPEEEVKKPKKLYLTPPNVTLPTPPNEALPVAEDATAELRKEANGQRWLYIALGNVIALSLLAFVIQRRMRRHRGVAKTQGVAQTDSGPAPETGTQ